MFRSHFLARFSARSLAVLPLFFAIHSLSTLAAELPTGVQPILDEKALDKTVNPCDNFYQFSCGGWINSIDLPEDKVAYYRQWSGMEDETEKKLNEILEAFAKGDTSGAKSKYSVQLGDFYKSCHCCPVQFSTMLG